MVPLTIIRYVYQFVNYIDINFIMKINRDLYTYKKKECILDKKYTGAKIRQVRIARGFSQEKLSEFVDISPRQMCLIENGNSTPSLETFVKIASILELDINDFFNLKSKNIEPDRLELIDIIKSIDAKKIPLLLELVSAVRKYK